MATAGDFIASPSEATFHSLDREQLLNVADYYAIDIDKRIKDSKIKSILMANLVDRGFLEGPPEELLKVSQPSPPTQFLTFEQQKELLMLQAEQQKFRLETELQVERLRAEQSRNEVEKSKLELIKEGKLMADAAGVTTGGRAALGSQSHDFDIFSNLRLVPKFNESDPETFFSMFERVAEVRNWPESARTLMLQCMLTGRAQEAYSCLSPADSQNYSKVKSAVLKAFELVPEAYRRRFRTWRRREKTHLEFARDLSCYFARWCAALDVKDFAGLCDLIVLEQFKNTLPEHIANYISNREVKTAAEAAALADEYVLTHKRSYGEHRSSGQQHAGSDGVTSGGDTSSGRSGVAVAPEATADHGSRDEKTCNFCHKKGHWKSDCYALKAKTMSTSPSAKGACMSVPAPRKGEVQVKGVGGSCQNVEIESYRPFVSQGFVSLVGSNDKVPVKILRDTAAFDTFIEASALPFTAESATGSSVPVIGMDLSVLHVPVHKIMLHSDFFQGLANVAVRPALPMAGINVILGNGLAGARVWADAPPSFVVNSVPLVKVPSDLSKSGFPVKSTASAVPHAMTHAKSEENTGQNTTVVPGSMFSKTVFPFSVPRGDLRVAQHAGRSLKRLQNQVVPGSGMENSACSPLMDGLLNVPCPVVKKKRKKKLNAC